MVSSCHDAFAQTTHTEPLAGTVLPLSAKIRNHQPAPASIGRSYFTAARPLAMSQPPATARSPVPQRARCSVVLPSFWMLQPIERMVNRLVGSELAGPGVAAIWAAVWPFSVAASVAGPGMAATWPAVWPFSFWAFLATSATLALLADPAFLANGTTFAATPVPASATNSASIEMTSDGVIRTPRRRNLRTLLLLSYEA